MAILSDDFSDHQIIIVSMYDNYSLPNENITELTDRLLPFIKWEKNMIQRGKQQGSTWSIGGKI